jgi:hypothetical protein
MTLIFLVDVTEASRRQEDEKLRLLKYSKRGFMQS